MTRSKVGRPPHLPTGETRNLVESLSGWRSRSLSSRSAISIALSRPASSGRASAGVITMQVNHNRPQLTTALARCDQLVAVGTAVWRGS